MNSILPGAPWLIAHRSMVGVNRPYKITLNSQDYVLWQTTKGSICGLENICPHMQAPLSEGWICESRNSIACPFHALEFSGSGELLRDGKPNGQAIAKPLKLIIQDDLIWTYGGFEPRLPVPDLIPQKTAGLSFLGVAGEKSIPAGFLDCIKINYDFNHQNGSHRASFKVRENQVHHFEGNGCYARVEQTLFRENNTLSEMLENPALLSTPKSYRSELEYSFPSTTMFRAEVSFGDIPQFFILYPETESRTKTFVLCYGKWTNLFFQLPGLNHLAQRALLKATAKVVEQDSATLESLYPRQQPKIKLPNEEIMNYAQRLYSEW
jgi:phenylpropionate dioxygenase-like ring-hydroxylating dioxygenase large terminal subunit